MSSPLMVKYTFFLRGSNPHPTIVFTPPYCRLLVVNWSFASRFGEPAKVGNQNTGNHGELLEKTWGTFYHESSWPSISIQLIKRKDSLSGLKDGYKSDHPVFIQCMTILEDTTVLLDSWFTNIENVPNLVFTAIQNYAHFPQAQRLTYLSCPELELAERKYHLTSPKTRWMWLFFKELPLKNLNIYPIRCASYKTRSKTAYIFQDNLCLQNPKFNLEDAESVNSQSLPSSEILHQLYTGRQNYYNDEHIFIVEHLRIIFCETIRHYFCWHLQIELVLKSDEEWLSQLKQNKMAP